LCVLLAVILTAALKPKPQKKLDPAKDIAPHVVPFYSIIHRQRLATGFHVKFGKNVYILTNRHVCLTNQRLYGDRIQFGNYVGTILEIDKKHDLCLVSSDRKDGLSISKTSAKPLDEVILVGYPRGIGKTIRFGHIIEAKYIMIGPSRFDTFQISAMAFGGNSGSPVCNKYGKVIGVLFAGSPMYPSEPYIVPYVYIVDFIHRAASAI